MNGWSASSYALGTDVSGIVTDLPASREFPITAGGSKNIVVKLVVSGVTVVGSISAKLQSAIGADWVDAKSVSITADGNVYIKLNIEVAADQAALPLLNKGRVVITTTDAGDEVLVSEAQILQEL